MVCLRSLALLALSACVVAADYTRTGTSFKNNHHTLTSAFRNASSKYAVPLPILLAVSYAETRWDDHRGQQSTSGGYGPMHLTEVPEAEEHAVTERGLRLHTLRRAAELTGLGTDALKSSPAANIAGGAALLAAYQRELALPTGVDTELQSWYRAVSEYPRIGGDAAFAEHVFEVLEKGARRVNNVGERIVLSAINTIATNPLHKSEQFHLLHTQSPRKTRRQTSDNQTTTVDCPSGLPCEWLPAPYSQFGTDDYGNHDLANRPITGHIDYILIHSTEGGWRGVLSSVQDPTYISWQYTMRSSDGYIWQHLAPKDIGWHAGNWYANMHSIGIEHEGFAAQGATWFTDSLYRNSARLVKHLAEEHGIKLDRAHVIGHDQVPGILPANVAGMHWDPGPFWDWERYFELLGAPIVSSHGGGDGSDNGGGGDVGNSTPSSPLTPGTPITIAPGFTSNIQPVTSCNGTGNTCPPNQGTNFIYLRQSANDSSPLVKDVGLRPGGSASTTQVSDIGARLAAGSQWVVAQVVAGDWVAVWYLGALGWFRNPAAKPVAYPISSSSSSSTVQLVVPKAGKASAPVYGRAYPEQAAYPADGSIPYQTVTPLQYTIGAGQAYVVGDADIETDYYRTATFNGTPPADHVQIKGADKYYLIWFGHRMAYVRAVDVDLVGSV